MRNIVIVSSLEQNLAEMTNNANAEVMTASQYCLDTSLKNQAIRVFNSCVSADYQSLGYYVSLIAEARGHNVLPSLTKAERCIERNFKTGKLKMAILLDEHDKSPPSNEPALQFFEAAARKLGITTQRIGKADIEALPQFDILFIRATTAVNHFSYSFAVEAWREGLVVIDDPASIVRCGNKIFLHEAIANTDIKAPKSFVLEKQIYKQQLDQLTIGYPCVLKLPDGCFSRGVAKAHNREECESLAQAFFEKSDLILAQEFMPTEFDWRIGIFNHQQIYACKYFMAQGHWQIYNWQAEATAHQAGESIAIDLAQVPAAVIETAFKTSEFMGNGFYGVDLKEHQDQAYVIEVNDNPSIDVGIEDQLLGKSLYDTILQQFLERLKQEGA